MSKVGIEEVKRLAALAKIGLSEQQAAALAVELGKIVEFVEQLQAVEVTDLSPTDQVTGLMDVWREDVVEPWPGTRAELLANAPEQQDGYIKVRRVL